MGVDCKIYLPSNVRVKDVADVMGMAAGLKGERKPLDGDYSWYWEVAGVSVVSTQLAVLADIQLIGPMIDGEYHHTVHYHFEASRGGMRLLMPRSKAFWIAQARVLVNFFGGYADYQDCDNSYEDYARWPKTDSENCPESDEPWQNFQERMEAIKPISKEELELCDQFAAYKMEHQWTHSTKTLES